MKDRDENPSEGKQSPDSSLPVWSCRVQGDPKEGQWTVGEVFGLHCEGPGAEFLSTQLHFRDSMGEIPYRLRVLKVLEESKNHLKMEATSYHPGRHSFQKLYIVDQGEEVVQVEPFSFLVKSIVQKPDQKPYGPIGAMKMAYPPWLWIVPVVFAVVGVFYLLFRWRRKAQMARVVRELMRHNTALGPFNQLNKDLRILGRKFLFDETKEWPESKKQSYIENLDQIFRMYLLREFYVPALDWSSTLVTKTLSRQDKLGYLHYGESLENFLEELDRAKKDSGKIKNHDCKQLTQMAKKVSQSIWNLRKDPKR